MSWFCCASCLTSRAVHNSGHFLYFSSWVNSNIFQSSPVQKLPVQKKPFCGFHSPVCPSASVKKPAPLFVPNVEGSLAEIIGSHFTAVRSISDLRRSIACEYVREPPGSSVSDGADWGCGAEESIRTVGGFSMRDIWSRTAARNWSLLVTDSPDTTRFTYPRRSFPHSPEWDRWWLLCPRLPSCTRRQSDY